MSDRHLPTAPPAPDLPVKAPGVEMEPPPSGGGNGGGNGGGDESGVRRAAPTRSAALVTGAGLVAGGLLLTLGLASLVGDAMRRSVLVEIDRDPTGSVPSYSDAPAEAAAFFARRDTLRVGVPRDMTVADFLSLYHLETNAAARSALRDQLGAGTDGDLLREGDRVTLTVTVPRITP